jgi:hypothetical protein
MMLRNAFLAVSRLCWAGAAPGTVVDATDILLAGVSSLQR